MVSTWAPANGAPQANGYRNGTNHEEIEVTNDTAIEVGQVYRRKPSGYLYRVELIDGTSGSSVSLRCLHDGRASWISPTGLRKKFAPLTPDNQ
jgi:hypothetical protein